MSRDKKRIHSLNRSMISEQYCSSISFKPDLRFRFTQAVKMTNKPGLTRSLRNISNLSKNNVLSVLSGFNGFP